MLNLSIASKILNKNPKYDVHFILNVRLEEFFRRWLDLKKSIPLKEVKRSS